jgi:hypothetical protein
MCHNFEFRYEQAPLFIMMMTARSSPFVGRTTTNVLPSTLVCVLLLSGLVAAVERTAVAAIPAAADNGHRTANKKKNAAFWSDHPDRVKILPGYAAGTPPVTIPSGYLHYTFEGEQIHTHYMLFRAEEAFFADDDDEPPLIYWSST